MENARSNVAAWLSKKQSPFIVGPAPYTPPKADEIVSTAACGLFEKEQLALDHPTVSPSSTTSPKTLLVWGGSTSVGSNAIQLAVAAWYEVFATASPRNFGYCEGLGASRVFDYNDENVVADLILALAGKTVAGALAIGAGSAERCVGVLRVCKRETTNKFVAMATYPVSFTQPLGRPVPILATVSRFLWSGVRLWLQTRPHGIRTKFIFGSTIVHNEVSRTLFADFLPTALAGGRFVAAPEAQIVGAGLESIQVALDVQRRGVSARKVVVSLP